jgi:hypothetical protein
MAMDGQASHRMTALIIGDVAVSVVRVNQGAWLRAQGTGRKEELKGRILWL